MIQMFAHVLKGLNVLPPKTKFVKKTSLQIPSNIVIEREMRQPRRRNSEINAMTEAKNHAFDHERLMKMK